MCGDLYHVILMVYNFGASFLFVVFDFLLFSGHILPIAIGHQCGAESKKSWEWFLSELKTAFPSFEHGSLIMDRDKGGDEATR